MDRKLGVLNILNLHIETEKADDFIVDLKKTLDKFLSFNKGASIKVVKITSNNQILPDTKVKKFTSTLIA